MFIHEEPIVIYLISLPLAQRTQRSDSYQRCCRESGELNKKFKTDRGSKLLGCLNVSVKTSTKYIIKAKLDYQSNSV